MWGPSEALAKPLSDAGEVTARTGHYWPPAPLLEVLEMRRLRIDQKTCRDREGCAFGRLRQSGNAERPADAHRTAENARRQIRQSGELAGAAGEDDVAALLGRERRGGELVAHHFEDFLDPRLDDVSERRPRHELRGVAFVVADRRHGDDVAFVQAADQHAAEQRLDAFGVGDAGIEPAGDV